jgi:hypothetical protein
MVMGNCPGLVIAALQILRGSILPRSTLHRRRESPGQLLGSKLDPPLGQGISPAHKLELLAPSAKLH